MPADGSARCVLRQIKVGIAGRGWMLRFGQRLLVPGFFLKLLDGYATKLAGANFFITGPTLSGG
jgi:hypothetical protein